MLVVEEVLVLVGLLALVETVVVEQEGLEQLLQYLAQPILVAVVAVQLLTLAVMVAQA
jgi:hypothetical protein